MKKSFVEILVFLILCNTLIYADENLLKKDKSIEALKSEKKLLLEKERDLELEIEALEEREVASGTLLPMTYKIWGGATLVGGLIYIIGGSFSVHKGIEKINDVNSQKKKEPQRSGEDLACEGLIGTGLEIVGGFFITGGSILLMSSIVVLAIETPSAPAFAYNSLKKDNCSELEEIAYTSSELKDIQAQTQEKIFKINQKIMALNSD